VLHGEVSHTPVVITNNLGVFDKYGIINKARSLPLVKRVNDLHALFENYYHNEMSIDTWNNKEQREYFLNKREQYLKQIHSEDLSDLIKLISKETA
jgi:hypothetical protein